MYSFRKYLTESKISDIKALQPNTNLSVFHGTSMNYAVDFVVNGIDAKRSAGRLYPHHIRGQKVTRGIYVTPDLSVGLGFGDVVIKFKVLGKNLFPMYSSRDSRRKSAPIDREMQKLYPKSFRPSVSYDMLTRGKENQALFRGQVSPRAIEKIYVRHYDAEGKYYQGRMGEFKASFTPKEFLKWVEDVYNPKQSNTRGKFRTDREPLVEPQEVNISPEEVAKRIVKQYELDLERAKKILKDNSSVKDLTGNLDIPYSVAKKLSKKLR